MLLLGGVKKLLHDDGMTIKGAQKVLREQGAKYVSGLSQPLDDDELEANRNMDSVDLVDAADRSAQAPQPSNEDLSNIEAVEAVETDANALESDEPEESAVVSFRSRADEPVEEDIEVSEEAPLASSLEVKGVDAPIQPDDETEPTQAPQIAESVKSSSSLPSFLKGEDTAPSGTNEPAKLAISTPDDPSDTSVDVDAGVLSRLAASKSSLSPVLVSALSKAQSELKSLIANR